MLFSLRGFLACGLIVVSSFAGAGPVLEDSAQMMQMTIGEVQTVEITNLPGDRLLPKDLHSFAYQSLAVNPAGILSEVVLGADVTELTVVGEKVWQLIRANRPVVNVQSQKVSVLPLEHSQWAQMSNWQGPENRTFVLSAKNLFGFEVIRYVYVLTFQHHGQWQNKGQYLANLTVIPQTVDVFWGFDLESHVEIGVITNQGTVEDPIPAVPVDISWKIKNSLNYHEGHDAFLVTGDGKLKSMAGRHFETLKETSNEKLK